MDSSGGLHGDTPTPKRLHGVVDICGENQSQTHAKSAKTGATARADNVQKHTQLQVASSIVTYVTSSPEQLSEVAVFHGAHVRGTLNRALRLQTLLRWCSFALPRAPYCGKRNTCMNAPPQHSSSPRFVQG